MNGFQVEQFLKFQAFGSKRLQKVESGDDINIFHQLSQHKGIIFQQCRIY